MNIEIAEHARMSERGSSLLRLIQNNDMPILDLLVRESVQNSLDAGLDGEGFVKIDFNIKDFVSADLNRHLEAVQENLDQKYPRGHYKLLEIRDSNTTGLTGPIHYSEVKDENFGNLLKLIYEISMPQHKEGAGGSWGLGKTVYFRIGIGLVFYYTRIKDDNGAYQSRLAACLVEDERKPDALIQLNDGKPKRGIAWWGQKVDEQSTMPLTDEKEIASVLKALNIQPYMNDETGTTIIIPYINENSLLEGIMPAEETLTKPWWILSVHDYIMVALQRWYAPRLMNPAYSFGRWLRARVNGEEICPDKMLPLFRAVQALYNRTPIANTQNRREDILKDIEVNVERVALRNIFNEDTTAGFFSFVKLTKDQLLMNYPHNNPCPFTQVNKFDVEAEENPPIIMFARQPGMIVGYEIAGVWTDGIYKTNNDEFIIGILVINSRNTLKHTDERLTLEEYIRKSEKADHTSWTDWNIGDYKPHIVSKIQRQVKIFVSNKYSKSSQETRTSQNLGLSKILADVLLPPENFGTKATLQKKEGTNAGGLRKTSRGFGLRLVGKATYRDGLIQQEFELVCGEKLSGYSIQLQVLSETGGINASEWESKEGIGTSFPLRLEEVTIKCMKKGKSVADLTENELRVSENQIEKIYDDIQVTLDLSEQFRIPCGVKFTGEGLKGSVLRGTAIFRTNDSVIKGSLSLVPIEGENQ